MSRYDASDGTDLPGRCYCRGASRRTYNDDMATLGELLTRARVREMSTNVSNATGSAATPAATTAAIPPGAVGVCKVRFNDGGVLRVPWGYVAGVQCDPIEKKPFFHAWPGALAYSFGMLGCDLHCAYCQNWVTSQALRDPAAVAPPRDVEPEATRRRRGPSGRARRGVDLQRTAHHGGVGGRGLQGGARRGLATGFVSNGNGTSQVLDYLDAVDRSLQGRSQELRRPAVPKARRAAAADSRHDPRAARTRAVGGDRDAARAGLQRLGRRAHALTEFLASVSPDIPWHVTAFHQDYRMLDPAATTAAQLQQAAAIGRRAGPALRLRRQSARPRRRSRRHALRVVRARRWSSATAITIRDISGDRGRPVPGVPDTGRPGAGIARLPVRSRRTPFLPHDRTRLRVI